MITTLNLAFPTIILTILTLALVSMASYISIETITRAASVSRSSTKN